jgi:hypothetical protein
MVHDDGSAALGPQLAKEAPVVRSDPFLHETSPTVESKDVQEVPNHAFPVGWEWTGR